MMYTPATYASINVKKISVWENCLLIILGIAILYLALTKSVMLFKVACLILFTLIIWLDHFNGLFCVIIIPFVSMALFIIDEKADFPFDIVIFGLWIGVLIIRQKGILKMFRLHFIDKLVLLYIALGIFYLLMSSQAQIAMRGFKYDYRPFLVYLLLRFGGAQEGDWKKATKFIIILMVLVVLDAFYWYVFDYMTAFDLQVKRAPDIPAVVVGIASFYGLIEGSVARLGSIWMYTTGLGPALMLTNILLIAQRKYISQRIGNLLCWSLMLFFTIGLFFTFSRSGIIGFLIGIFILFIAERMEKGKKRQLLPIIGFGIIIGLVILAAINISDVLFKRVEALWTTEFLPGGHFFFLALSLYIISQNPFGIGLGTGFASEIGSSMDAVWSESTMLKIGSEKGIFALFLFCLILIYLIREIKNRIALTEGHQKDFYRGMFVGGICIFLINITFPFWETIMTYYLLFGGVFAINQSAGYKRKLLFIKK